MNHSYIDQYDLVGRYLMGKLPSEEIEQFEEHFVDCPECIDRLKITRNFMQDLRTVTGRQASQTDSNRPARRHWYIPQMLTGKPLALAAGCLLVAAIVGAALVFSQMRRLRLEVDQAKSDTLQWERRYEEERQSASLSEKKRQELEQEFSVQLRDLEAKLQNEQRQRASMAAELEARMRPGVSMPTFPLTSVRAGNSSEPVNVITLTRTPMDFLILVDLEGEVKYKGYVLTILNDRDRLVWKGRDSKPDSFNSFSLPFNSKSFQPGNFLLIVKGVSAKSGLSTIGNYPFRIVKDR